LTKETCFEVFKGFITGFIPRENYSFLGQVNEGLSDVGVVRDEVSIEVAETQKGLYFFNRSRYWPISDSISLCHVHGYAS
jgi:hypothetical protein